MNSPIEAKRTDGLTPPDGPGWRPVYGDDGQVRAWVRGTATKPKPATECPPDVVERIDVDGIVHRECPPLTTR
jgi:hypothetical protein